MFKDIASSVSIFHFLSDGCADTIKQKVYTEALSAKVVIENAKQFSGAADRLCDITVMYLNAEGIESPD